jgi:selenide,water dikinase
MQLPLPLLKNVVLVGGGHAHALLLRRWAMNPVAGVRITLINPGPNAPYTGMLPGFIAGHYDRDELDIDLIRLARFADARLILGIVSHINRDDKTVIVPGRPPIPYDFCSLDVGINSAMDELPGFAEHVVAAKPLGRFADAWTAFVRSCETGTEKTARVAVIGGGVGGSELAMAMSHRLRSVGLTPEVTVIDRSTILGGLAEKARIEIRKTMAANDITVRENTTVTEISPNQVHTEEETVEADFIVGAAGARPYGWLSELGVETHDGFVTIDDSLRSVTDPTIFAVGDCAHMGFAPRPKAGVYAVRQAPVLTNNMQALLTGGKLKTFDPQVDYLKLISLGEKSAAADRFKQFVQGKQMWRLKNKIDQDFMAKFGDLPEMEATPLPKNAAAGLREAIEDEPPLCGGCGAKVGIDILAGPLGDLPTSTRGDVVRLPGDDAAVLDMGATKQVITTDQLRTFTPDPFRMAKIATLHAMGDIWAMGAKPQAVLVTVTLPQLHRRLQSEWLGEIMAGTSAALDSTGAEVVGGHTSMGAELSLGYSLTGLLDAPAITLAGATAGQRLVLTRPLGSGLLFAGEMQRKAHGADVAALLDELERPQGNAAAALAAANATAMTDVTGFGLAGHLFGMLRESNVSAELVLDDIPSFPGALKLATDGLRSHLHASNAAAIPFTQRGNDPRATLLFDPQTAGGLLAAVPAENADEVLEELEAMGHRSAIIGTIVAGTPEIRVS